MRKWFVGVGIPPISCEPVVVFLSCEFSTNFWKFYVSVGYGSGVWALSAPQKPSVAYFNISFLAAQHFYAVLLSDDLAFVGCFQDASATSS